MDEFEEILLQHRKYRFLVVNPLGTKGDQLICMGMEKKLKELGMKYKVLRYRKKTLFRESCLKAKKILSILKLASVTKRLEYIARLMCNLTDKKVSEIQSTSKDVILIRGGGYLNDLWKDYYILQNVILKNPHRTVILAPHSFYFDNTRFSEFFRSCKQQIYLFCRERYSYNLLRSLSFPENVHVRLSHDTSLYLSKDDFRPQNGPYDLICPRDDRESAVVWKIESSRQRKVLVGDLERVRDFKAFVNLIEGSRGVYTDRLHVAILAAILGKDTFLYPNCYPKNKGVYEFSLYNFSNVRFVDSLEFLGIENYGS